MTKKNTAEVFFLSFFDQKLQFYEKKNKKKENFLTSLKSLKKGVRSGVGSRVGSGAGSISERYGSEDPDPHQNVTDPQHWLDRYSHVPRFTLATNDGRAFINMSKSGYPTTRTHPQRAQKQEIDRQTINQPVS
jgi:hypothetical protein